jgi:hypothetical protein
MDCGSQLCEAGVCCKSSTPCSGTCIGCAQGTGECKARPIGQDDPGTCEGANTCGPNGTCGLKNGQECSKDSECAHGFCTDGFCCNTRCDEPCASCALRKEEGICSPISADELPRSTCPKGYQCSGKDLACVPPICDGKGRSVALDGTVTECAPYVCAGACLEKCRSVDDCLEPFVCDGAGRCVAPAAGSASCVMAGANGQTNAVLVLLAIVIAARKRRSR